MSDNGFDQFQGSPDYVASDDLRKAVNVAIALQKPLLVRGEPGTGKTLLATSIAGGLDKKLIIWNIKSTTKAQEGLYVYDTVQRLNDSRFGDTDVPAHNWRPAARLHGYRYPARRIHAPGFEHLIRPTQDTVC